MAEALVVHGLHCDGALAAVKRDWCARHARYALLDASAKKPRLLEQQGAAVRGWMAMNRLYGQRFSW